MERKQKTFLVTGCGCGMRFCESCAFVASKKIRECLPRIVAKWANPMMLTFTIDPALFDGNCAEAFAYSLAERAIGKTMKELRRLGYVGEHYYCAIEWQGNGMPHWHVLCDSPFVPQRELLRIWGLLRPASAGEFVQLWNEDGTMHNSPFGWCSCNTSNSTFGDGGDLVHYGIKYVTKTPAAGYPDWVLNYRGNLHRHSVSKGFWQQAGGCAPVDSVDGPVDSVGAMLPDSLRESLGFSHPVADPSDRPTIQERLNLCNCQSVIREVEEVDGEDGEIISRSRVLARIDLSLESVGLIDGFISPPARSWVIGEAFARDLAARCRVVPQLRLGDFPELNWTAGHKVLVPQKQTHNSRTFGRDEQFSLILDNGEFISDANYLG